MVTVYVSNFHLYTCVLRVIISWKVRPKIIEAVKNTERERERESGRERGGRLRLMLCWKKIESPKRIVVV